MINNNIINNNIQKRNNVNHSNYNCHSRSTVPRALSTGPEGRGADPGPAEVEGPQGVGVRGPGQVAQGQLQVLLAEQLVGQVQLPQAAAPLLRQLVEVLPGRGRPGVTLGVKVLTPEQTLQLWVGWREGAGIKHNKGL